MPSYIISVGSCLFSALRDSSAISTPLFNLTSLLLNEQSALDGPNPKDIDCRTQLCVWFVVDVHFFLCYAKKANPKQDCRTTLIYDRDVLCFYSYLFPLTSALSSSGPLCYGWQKPLFVSDWENTSLFFDSLSVKQWQFGRFRVNAARAP